MDMPRLQLSDPRLLVARLSAVVGTAITLAVPLGEDLRRVMLARLPFDLVALVAVSRRAWRMPAALWFGNGGFLWLARQLATEGDVAHEAWWLLAGLAGAIAAVALLWPKTPPRPDTPAPLPGLPLT